MADKSARLDRSDTCHNTHRQTPAIDEGSPALDEGGGAAPPPALNPPAAADDPRWSGMGIRALEKEYREVSADAQRLRNIICTWMKECDEEGATDLMLRVDYRIRERERALRIHIEGRRCPQRAPKNSGGGGGWRYDD